MYKGVLFLCVILVAASAFPNPFRKKKPKTTSQMVANTNFLVFPQDIGRYINEIRLRPSILVPMIEQKLKTFTNDKKIKVGWRSYPTYEGKAAWEEALRFVKTLKPMGPLNFSVVLERAAIDHAVDLAVHNALSHVGSKGESLVERVGKYTNYNFGTISEVLVTEFEDKPRNHALQTILSLIVNDGLSSRAYRNALFNPANRFFGQASRMGNKKAIVVILFGTNTYELALQAAPKKNGKGITSQKMVIKGPAVNRSPLISNTTKVSSTKTAPLKSVLEARVTSVLIAGSERKHIHRIFVDGSQEMETRVINLSV